LASGLADYEDGLSRLLGQHWDPELYRTLSDRFDLMQQYASALPRLSASWTELLISRTELLHAMWSLRTPTRVDGRVEAMLARHKVLIAQVRAQCGEYAARAARAPTARH
ncbi:MAG TPA: hypothetical protein VHL79_24880, partial [Ramlibacter sp.]|nr:hypothetical protein [Ramlibacter sp.]